MYIYISEHLFSEPPAPSPSSLLSRPPCFLFTEEIPSDDSQFRLFVPQVFLNLSFSFCICQGTVFSPSSIPTMFSGRAAQEHEMGSERAYTSKNREKLLCFCFSFYVFSGHAHFSH